MSKLRRMKEGNALPPAFDLQAVVSTTDLDMADSCICSAATCHPISKITEHIYVGSWKDSQDPDILAKYGITYVLNIAAEHDPEDILETVPGVNNKWIPLKDAQSQNITQVLDDAFNFLETARLKHAKALVHCRRGISRSPAIVIAYLMATEGRSLPQRPRLRFDAKTLRFTLI
ncbi:dual specificity protein phosphatase or MAP kinase phosphatase [Angomonas deanei]|nr:dual specificity protein phosphatase or MAP kinase phosphatase [Angomonas deanei]|eukprot:EPY38921.1 dual specificity protein phosphatase or MAP kinase phosphatase [Angomonas deanei]